MSISKTQEKRIRESRKRFTKSKEEFILSTVEPSRRQEVAHRNALLSAVAQTKDVIMEAYNETDSLSLIKQRFESLYSEMAWWDTLNEQAQGLISGMDDWHREQFYETASTATGINIAGFVSEQGLGDLLRSMVEVNVDQITDLKEASRKRVVDLVNNSLAGQEEKSPTLSKALREAFNGITSREARFIARDQTQRAVNGLNRFRQERAGIRKYKWITSKDNRVRASHKQMDGLEVSWETGRILSTPLSKKRGLAGKDVKKVANGHIGQDYQCRCTASAILEI